MNISQFRKLALGSLIGFLSLSALIAIWALLSGDFGSTQVKVILTTLTIFGASICAMACAAFIEKRSGSSVGMLGILCAAVAAGMTIGGIWGEFGSEPYWKSTMTLVVLSVAFAHGLLLFLPSLSPGYRWSQAALALAGAILAGMIIFAIWAEVSGSGYYRVMGVVAVVVVLLTLVVPILARLGSGAKPSGPTLVLTPQEGNIYTDASGQRYQVTRI